LANIRFGACLSGYQDLNDLNSIRQFAQRAEDLGFDSLWVTENVHGDSPALESLITLAVFASYTQRIKVGVSILLLPLRNAVNLAHMIATLDVLSGGRLILGVGVGGDAPDGYQAYGVGLNERAKRCDEALEVMTKLWTGRPVSIAGEYNNFADYTLGLRPLQKPHPPIWIGGGGSARVFHRAAKWADGYIPTYVTPEECGRRFEQVTQYGQENGRDMLSFTKALHSHFCLASSTEEARRVAEDVLEERYHYKVSLKGVDSELFGTPNDIVGIIQDFVSVGVSHFVLDAACPGEEVLSQLETIAGEVLPNFR